MSSETDSLPGFFTPAETPSNDYMDVSAVDKDQVSSTDYTQSKHSISLGPLQTCACGALPGRSAITAQKGYLRRDIEDGEAEIRAHRHKKPDRPQKTCFFGLAQEKKLSGYIPLDDYECRYPPDEFGQEMGPGARVWHVYLDEAELNDRDMIEGWKDGIDVLLVFAGLFSAVVTTFVAQTSQKLDKDYGQVSASLLTELVAIQRAIAIGSTIDDIQSSQFTFSSLPTYSRADAWVNGLWFTSLTLSLATALFAVLIKQWIQHYISFVSGSALERARIHQFRYSGLERWGVRAIIGVLPLLLYMALFLFIFGLAVFLQAMKPEIAYMVIAIGGATIISYVVTNGLPIFYPHCPYRTPLIEYINATISFGSFILRRISFSLTRLFAFLFLAALNLPAKPCGGSWTRSNQFKQWLKALLYVGPPTYELKAPKSSESHAAELEQDEIIQKIIEWLLTVSSNPSAKSIALQSISGLPARFSRVTEMLDEGCLARRELDNELERQCSISRNFGDDPGPLVESVQFYNTERICRASIFASAYPEDWDPRDPSRVVWKPLSWKSFDSALPSPDYSAPFWLAVATYRVLSIGEHSPDTPENVLRKLSPLATTFFAQQYPAIWEAWAKTLGKCMSTPRHAIDIVTIYGCMRPLFQLLLEPESDSDTWANFLPTLCYLLPPTLVQESFDSLPDKFHLLTQNLPAARIKYRSLLLSCVITELDTSNNLGQAALERVVRDICYGLYEAVGSYRGNDANALPRLAVILDKLVGHKGFAQSSWDRHTYESIFSIYFKAFMSKSVPLPTSDVSCLGHFRNVLESQEWVHRCLNDLFDRYDSEPVSSKIASQIAGALGGLNPNSPIIKNILDAFMETSSIKSYLTKDKSASACEIPWPPHMQPLVRCLLDYIIHHDEAIHSHIHAFAANLIERDGFLTFVCSPFIGCRRDVVFSKESLVLARLAEYHKGKPGGTGVWRNFLSWIQKWSNELCCDTRSHKHWTRSNFDKYASMADFVNQLASTIGFDDPRLKVVRFQEDYVIKLLKKNGHLPYTYPLHTGTASLVSPNHQSVATDIHTRAGENIDSTVDDNGILTMV